MSRWIHSALFQSIVIATLIIVCVFFATRPEYGQHSQGEDYCSAPHTEREGEEKIPGFSPEWWTAIFTGVLSIFTIALAGSTIGLWVAGERQFRTTTKIAARQSIQTRKSIAIAEKALEAGESPYIFVIARSPIGPQQGISLTTREPMFGRDDKHFVEYTINNFGKSPAIILSIATRCVFSNRFPEQMPFPAHDIKLTIYEAIASGGSSKTRKISNVNIVNEKSGKKGKSIGWFLIQIKYQDILGNQFISAFCYGRNQNMSFVCIGGPSRNYRRKLTEEECNTALVRDADDEETEK
jgi:hypothetical protein